LFLSAPNEEQGLGDGIRIGENPDYFNAAGTFPVDLGSFRPEGTE